MTKGEVLQGEDGAFVNSFSRLQVSNFTFSSERLAAKSGLTRLLPKLQAGKGLSLHADTQGTISHSI